MPLTVYLVDHHGTHVRSSPQIEHLTPLAIPTTTAITSTSPSPSPLE